jgi:hypothetical protein
MAIRRPSINSPTWLFQDFLQFEDGAEQSRYLQVKWDGEIFERVSPSFDYSNPPYLDINQKGGPIVAQLNYTIEDKLVTVTDWFVNWRDEWPLRIGINYFRSCLYSPEKGYVLRVRQGEVYNQSGEPIPVANKDAYAFWVSEFFKPLTNLPGDYLYY